MKKNILLTLILTLLLTACGGNTGTNPDTQFDPNTQELPLSTKLAIGTLKLENTDNAIASDQAAELLPLWQVLKSLTNSDSAAPEEITAITEQIQETMTPQQTRAIEEMGLTGQDIFATMQEMGLATGFGQSAESADGFGQGRGPGGEGFPGGGPPGGGPGGGFGGQELSPEQMATAQARRAENGGGMNSRILAPLTETVIELLEAKAQ